jgi:hypothetical protein
MDGRPIGDFIHINYRLCNLDKWAAGGPCRGGFEAQKDENLLELEGSWSVASLANETEEIPLIVQIFSLERAQNPTIAHSSCIFLN